MDPPGPGSKPRPEPAPSCVSMRSDRSKDWPVAFKEACHEEQREPCPKEQLDAIFRRLEKDVLTFVKEQLQRLHRLLASDYPECSESEEEEQSSREVLNITLDFLRRMDQEQLAQRCSTALLHVKDSNSPGELEAPGSDFICQTHLSFNALPVGLFAPLMAIRDNAVREQGADHIEQTTEQGY
ncbi:hypothetical protein WMY93_001006 [Mugilogobius chulae]|uniref:Uncharacterized protein n=1 Tax=Mugilogobius chulae TaxID=88201 RepID=A0AAW0Q201_9GOBI